MPELTSNQLLTVIGALANELGRANAELDAATKAIDTQASQISGYEVQEHNIAGMAVALYPELKQEPNLYERIRLAFVKAGKLS